jgi:hypothetical protein
MKESAAFLARFSLWACLSFAVWEAVGSRYVDLVAPATNALSSLSGVPVHLDRQGEMVLHAVSPPGGRSFRVQAQAHSSIYLNLVVAVSLFGATIGRRPGWPWAWAGAALVLLWASHVVSFYLSGQIAAWHVAGADPRIADLVQQLSPFVPKDRAELLLRILEQWNMWARYGLPLAVWFGTMSSSPQATSPAVGRPPRPVLRAEGVPAA